MKNLFKFSIFIVSALFVLAGCSKDDIDSPEELQKDNVYKVSVNAKKESDESLTKALAVENRNGKHYLASSWKTSEVVYAFLDLEKPANGSLSPKADGESAILEGNITGSIKQNDLVYFTFPADSYEFNYTGQDGTLETIAQNYDFSTALAKVASVTSTDITFDRSLTFSPVQSIVKFTLVDKNGDPVCPKKLKLVGLDSDDKQVIRQVVGLNATSGPLEISIDQTTPRNEIYVSLNLNGEASEFWLYAYMGDNPVRYQYTRDNVEFTKGKYYEIKVKFGDPIAQEAVKCNFTVTEDGGEWTQDGPVYVFFENITGGYLKLTKDGDTWQQDIVSTDGVYASDFNSNGKMTAIYAYNLPSDVKPVYSGGKWSFEGADGIRYMSAEKIAYTYNTDEYGIELSGEIDLISHTDTDCFYVNPEKANSTRIACNNLVPAGLSSIDATCTISEKTGNAGDWIDVIGEQYAYAKMATSLASTYYYALQTTSSGKNSYYHIFDSASSSRLTPGTDGAAHISAAGGADWIQVGPGKFVTMDGIQWWTTNLNSEMGPEVHPWTTVTHYFMDSYDEADINNNLGNRSFTAASSNDSRLPEKSEFESLLTQVNKYNVHICGISGLILAENSTSFMFLPVPLDRYDWYGYDEQHNYADLIDGWCYYWLKDYAGPVFHPEDYINGQFNPGYWWTFYWVESFRFGKVNTDTWDCEITLAQTDCYFTEDCPEGTWWRFFNNFPARPVKN